MKGDKKSKGNVLCWSTLPSSSSWRFDQAALVFRSSQPRYAPWAARYLKRSHFVLDTMKGEMKSWSILVTRLSYSCGCSCGCTVP